MSEIAPIQPVVLTRELTCTPHQAFLLCTTELGRWWPSYYTFSNHDLETILVEPQAGGRCMERDSAGNEYQWGVVEAVQADEPPLRITFRWMIDFDRTPQPDAEQASRVELTFHEAEGGTRLELLHDQWERHVDRQKDYRDALASMLGWPLLLDQLRDACR